MVVTKIADQVQRLIGLMSSLPEWLVAVAARLAVGMVFWTSARLKVDGLTLKDSTYFLFEHEYALPLIPHEWAAVAATLAEHMFAVSLFIGFATRFGALGLLGMTAVIQTFVYPDAWVTHLMWATGLLYLIIRGPGPFSIDHLIARRFADRA